MPFLTLEDPNAKIKGSRDPLGIVPVWSAFARHVVTNLTTPSNSVRGFTTLLLGRYFSQILYDEGAARQEDSLNICLRMEQLSAYARHLGHDAGGEVRGIDRVKRNLGDAKGKVIIQADRRGAILSDQKVYGLWGLFSVPARVSGLLADGPFGVTNKTREFIERNYVTRLQKDLSALKRMLAKGGTLDTKYRPRFFNALIEILAPAYTPEEVEFYGYALRDAEGVPSNRDRRQGKFRRLLEEYTDLEQITGREDLVRLSGAARKEDEGLALSLERILILEALIAPATVLLDFLLTQGGQRPADAAEKVRESWGKKVPNVDAEAFLGLLDEIGKVYDSTLARIMGRCSAQLQAGDYVGALQTILAWNARVMEGRKASPWVSVGENGRIDVRYRGMERLLPEKEALSDLWLNSYFIDSLKNVTLQLRSVA